MVPVRKNRERKGACPARHANMSIKGHVRVEKWPRGATPEVGERRNIDSAGDVRRIRRIVDHILGQQCRIGEWRRAVDEGVELNVTGDGGGFSNLPFPLLPCLFANSAKQKISLMRRRTFIVDTITSQASPFYRDRLSAKAVGYTKRP